MDMMQIVSHITTMSWIMNH